jgi:hypothetical protein
MAKNMHRPDDACRTANVHSVHILFFVLRLLFFFFLIERYVSEVEHHIYAYHNEVETIEEEHVPLRANICKISLVQKLGNDTGYVTEEYEAEERKALSLRSSRSVRADYVHRPGYAKAHYHNNFENFSHFSSPNFLSDLLYPRSPKKSSGVGDYRYTVVYALEAILAHGYVNPCAVYLDKPGKIVGVG